MAQEPTLDRLHTLLRDNAACLMPSAELRERVLASAPGHTQRLESVLRRAQPLSTSVSLSERILAAAPEGGLHGFIASLWPFGPLWRPALGFAALVGCGVFLGGAYAAALRGEVSINGALSEEIYVLAMSVAGPPGPGDSAWAE